MTDPERIIATALTTVETPTLLPFIKDYCAREEVDIFVIGEAKRMDGTPSQSAQYIEPFVKLLATAVPDKSIRRIDERFTSKIAFQSMIDSGLKKKDRRNKGTIDQVAATIMLQDFMRMLSSGL